VFAGALGIAALGLFFLPALLGVGGGGGSSTSRPSTSAAAASASPSPTTVAAPTPQVYIVKANDTMLKIARKFGVTVEALLAANKDIKDADKIAIGDQIIIPAPSPADFTDPSASATP